MTTSPHSAEPAARTTSPQPISFPSLEPRSSTGFVGLSNQGATCYLNSLIQSLFMTPEVRKLIYSFLYDRELHGEPETCIPLQLQYLFARLQLTKGKSASTKALTSSFGWTSSDSFVQHDVQELCRVLFDAVDLYLSRSDPQNSNRLSELYTGTMIDYIRTSEPVTVDPAQPPRFVTRERRDTYMDVQLVIRDCSSIENALEKFVESETLSGENAWNCEELGAKVDAIKGLKFVSPLPHILTLHLKRFDYDYTTWQRIKLHNRVSFPWTLDMSKFVEPEQERFELFSVLIHSGSATGGHYYAYIKDGESWYSFNDSNVTPITTEEVERMFGSDDDTGASRWGSSTNAYMLMYRKISEDGAKTQFPGPEEIPADVRELIEAENAEFVRQRGQWVEEQSKINIRVHYRSPFKNENDSMSLELRKSQTVKQAKEELARALSEKLSAPPVAVIAVEGQSADAPPAQQTTVVNPVELTAEHVRLREYKLFDHSVGKAWEIEDDKKLEELSWGWATHVFAETRASVDAPWPVVRETVNAYIIVLDPKTGEFHQGMTLRFEDMPMDEFRRYITRQFLEHVQDARDAKLHLAETFADASHPALDENTNSIIMIHSQGDTKQVIDTNQPGKFLLEAGLGARGLVYLEFLPQGSDPAVDSKLQEKIEEQDNEVTFQYNLLGDNNYSQYLTIDKRKTFGELRRRLAQQLGREDVDSIRLLYRETKLPYRIADDAIIKDAVPEYTCFHVDDSHTLKEGEHLIKLFKYVPLELKPDQPAATSDSAADSEQKQTEPIVIDGDDNTGEPSSKKPRIDTSDDASTAMDTSTDEAPAVYGPVPPPPPPPPPLPAIPPHVSFVSASTALVPVADGNGTSSSWNFTRPLALTPYTALGKLIISKHVTLRELKERISARLEWPIEKIRVRPKTYTLLGNILHEDGRTLAEVWPAIDDGKQLAVQLLDEPEQPLADGCQVVYFKRWHSSTWKFDPTFEVILNRNECVSMQDLQERVASALATAQASSEDTDMTLPPAARLQFAKSPADFKSWANKECADIPLLAWQDEAKNVWNPPFKLSQDDLVFVRDRDEPERVPIDELKNMILNSTAEQKPAVVYNGSLHSTRRTETALKIKTIFDSPPPSADSKQTSPLAQAQSGDAVVDGNKQTRVI